MIDKLLAVMSSALDLLERWLSSSAPRWQGPVAVCDGEYQRAVGFCSNLGCPWYHKQSFLLAQRPPYLCQTCGREGTYVPEERWLEGGADVVRRVEVHYDFNPTTLKYQNTAVVEDRELRNGSTYTLRSPLIRTSKRALTVAELTLAGLQRYLAVGPDSVPVTETILCLDDPRDKFAEDCEMLRQSLQNSALVNRRGRR